MKPKLVYIASPYWHNDPNIRQARYEEVRAITADIMRAVSPEIVPHSPIVYTHSFAVEEGVKINWYELDFLYLDRCDAMFVAKMDGWQNSKGVENEIQYCIENKTPFCVSRPEDIIDDIMSYQNWANINDNSADTQISPH